MDRTTVVCREIVRNDDLALDPTCVLYEATQADDERIPWEWIGRTPERRAGWKPGRWSPHLIVAEEPGGPVGFIYGGLIPNFGGYVCYMGVAPAARGRGVGTALFRSIFDPLRHDGAVEGGGLPFVVWESRRPDRGAGPAARELWEARVRLFGRVGALWVDGVELLTPNYDDEDGPAVPLQLFVAPFDRPASAFDAAVLRDVAAGLSRAIYKREPDESLASMRPALRPPLEAVPRREKPLAVA